jgi:hypothetical protein
MIDKLLRWYISQPEIERKECHVEQLKRINVMKNGARKDGLKLEDVGELYYHALLEGIRVRSRLHSNRRLHTNDDLDDVTLQRIAAIKSTSKAKPSPVLDRLQGDLEPVVLKLRSEGLSWQKVSVYLAKYHKLNCNRTYLQKVCGGP